MEEILKEIKQTGYWRILIRPTIFVKTKIDSLAKCKEIIRQSAVRLRGWDFPHLDRDETLNGIDWIESGCDFGDMKEYWRFYQSGQFIHYSAIREDYLREEIIKDAGAPINHYPDKSKLPSRFMSIISTIYRVTEVYEFASRLVEKDILEPSLEISVTLTGMKDRLLFFWDWYRDLLGPYTSRLDEFECPRKEYDTNDFLANKESYAEECIVWIFERFNWDSPPRSLVRETQKKFLQKRT